MRRILSFSDLFTNVVILSTQQMVLLGTTEAHIPTFHLSAGASYGCVCASSTTLMSTCYAAVVRSVIMSRALRGISGVAIERAVWPGTSLTCLWGSTVSKETSDLYEATSLLFRSTCVASVERSNVHQYMAKFGHFMVANRTPLLTLQSPLI